MHLIWTIHTLKLLHTFGKYIYEFSTKFLLNLFVTPDSINIILVFQFHLLFAMGVY